MILVSGMLLKRVYNNMGYFTLKQGDSWQDYLDAAIGNLILIKKAGNDDYEYLFEIAESYLKEARAKYLEQLKTK